MQQTSSFSAFPEYHKINSIFKRGERNRFIEGDWACPEFGYLADSLWHWTEKVDGTNVRVLFTPEANQRYYERPEFGGRTDNAQMPVHLAERLRELFDTEEMRDVIAVKAMDQDGSLPTFTLYGEGYGAKIQKGGVYLPDRCDFILFDVKVGDWWLTPEAVTDVADKLGVERVPVVGEMTLNWAIDCIKNKRYKSHWPNATIEGLVGTPVVPLFTRRGHRIIAKVKTRDF